MTDAPVDLDELQSYCDAAAGLPGATAIGVDSRDLARLIAELRASRAAPPADHEPFAPMECCGRDRDKDGGPNPHCECPAPFKASPADEVAGLLADCARLRACANGETGCAEMDDDIAALARIENHLKGKR